MTLRLAPACLVLAGAGAIALVVGAGGSAGAGAIAATAPPAVPAATRSAALTETRRITVPVIAQAPERCGPAALAMVLRFYGAPDSAVAEADRAYSPALGGTLITDLARAAERAGFAARVAPLTEDSLLVMLRDSLPPVLYYWSGMGLLTRGHYGVLVGWDFARREYLVNDGGARTARYRRDDLMKRWRAAGTLALIVRRRAP